MVRKRLSDKIREARAVPVEQLAESLIPFAVLADRKFVFRLKSTPQLKQDERNILWSMTEINMRDMSAGSSMGWSPGPKKRELFHRLTRFILAYDDRGELVGFASFRFDHEDDRDELYCYELQITDGMRGLGLGTNLLLQLEAIGTARSVEQVVLTVLKVNAAAMRFYKANGFEIDDTSPNDPSCDYEILSLRLISKNT